MDTIKSRVLLSKDLWIPVGVVGTIIALVFSGTIFLVNLANQVALNKETVSNHISIDDARVELIRGQITNFQSEQAKVSVKLDYIVAALDELKANNK